MRKCEHCQVAIKGDWQKCPLCHQSLNLTAPLSPSSYPDVPLQFNNQRIVKWLVWLSVWIIGVIFAVAFIWQGEIRLFEGTVLAIGTIWLVVLIILRKRRNLSKSVLYLLVILSLISIYLDYLLGWKGWSLSYSIPIFCSSSLLGMFLSIRLVKMKPGDYILYLVAADLLGLVPAVFLILGWVSVKIPALLSVLLSVLMLFFIVGFRWQIIRRELKKRTFI